MSEGGTQEDSHLDEGRAIALLAAREERATFL